MEISGPLRVALQIVAALITLMGVYAFSLWLLNKEALVSDPNSVRPPKMTAKILDGYAESTILAQASWSTINRDAYNYVTLPRSYNRKGGAQFSYSMWIRLRDTSAPNVAGKTLFMRGDPTSYKWHTYQKNPGSSLTEVVSKHNDVMIKCPRVRFGRTFDEIIVEFNTLTDPSGSITITPDAQPSPIAQGGNAYTSSAGVEPSLRRNAVQLMQGRWALLTFTFEDNIAINEFEDGIMVRFYLNDLLYTTSTSRSALRQNNGDFLICPSLGADLGGEQKINGATFGDMSYHNYALGLPLVRELYTKGPPTKAAVIQSGGLGEPLYLSEYNKLDVYNT